MTCPPAFDGPAGRTIWVQAVDDDGVYELPLIQVQVDNVAPTVVLSGDAAGREGSAYVLGLQGIDPGQDIVRWEINWGDEQAEQTAYGNPSSVSHVYEDDGSYTIRARAHDQDGAASVLAQKSVAVADVPPTLSVSGEQMFSRVAEYHLRLRASDPGADGPVTWTVDWGDGGVAGDDEVQVLHRRSAASVGMGRSFGEPRTVSNRGSPGGLAFLRRSEAVAL